MSRSKKKTPIRGMTTVKSDKWDKQLANRRHRHATNQALRVTSEEAGLPGVYEFGHVSNMNKDGKSWFDADGEPKSMRK